jgi:hypothetical protein
MDMSVALLMDQRNVEDCPGSMVDGSAVKLAITGPAVVGGAVAIGVEGGGGGGGGAFFAQLAANNTTMNNTTMNNSGATNVTAPGLEACNLELSVILKSPLGGSLLIIVLTYSKQVFRCFLAW